MPNTTLQKLQNKQVLMMYVSICLCLMAFMLWLFIPYFIQPFNPSIFLGALFGFIILAAIPFLYPNFKKKQNKHLLDQINAHPKMEYSTQLLLKKTEQLNSLEKIQLAKIRRRIEGVLKEVDIQHFLGKAFFCFLVNLVLVGCVVQFQLKAKAKSSTYQVDETAHLPQQLTKPIENPVAKLKNYNVRIVPPKYTNLKSSTQKKLAIEMPEGSQLEWKLHFDNIPPTPFLEINGKTTPFNTNDSINYSIKYTAKQKTLYSLQIDTLVQASIFHVLHSIKIIPDKKPHVSITNLKNYEQVRLSALAPQTVNYILQDDYGISKAELELTKSSGDGESVSFELKNYALPLVRKNIEQAIKINLQDLKPQAGDEFFIRIKAIDNHPSKMQSVFSDTYIVAIEDTTKKKADFTMALGMDREPEYFRSQRQIIIDTENLIKKKSELSELTFKDESNNLGIEQKILRLRYGKFLGEEFEGTIGVRTSKKMKSHVSEKELNSIVETAKTNHNSQNEIEHQHDHDEDCTHHHDHDKDDLHQEEADHNHEHHHHTQENTEHKHDEDCEHPHAEEHEHSNKPDSQTNHETAHNHSHDHADHNHHNHNHDHGNESENPEEPVNWIAPFQHFHDNAESNTFFESEVKAKLKAALAQMWDAELQLRLGKPKLSLPYQHKALKLIKEVQQASRVYVERVGLDLPKIDVAKKRLSGELDEIIDPKHNYDIQPDEIIQNIYIALQHIQSLKLQREYSENAGQTLAEIKILLDGLWLSNENYYIQSIHVLNQIPHKKVKLQELQFILNSFLKENDPISGKAVQKYSRLESLYWDVFND